MLETILLGIVSSTLAAIIVFIFGTLISKNIKWLVISILSRITNSEIEYVFKNKKDAKEDIIKEISKTFELKILTGRGNELARDTFESKLKNKPKGFTSKTKLILPDTSDNHKYDWVTKKENELSENDKSYRSKGTLKKEIENNIQRLEKYIEDGDLELKLSPLPIIGRIILTDNYAYYQPYSKNNHWSLDPVVKYRRGSFYDNYERYFDLIWETAIKQ
jgi:hypothetical protein